jgi:hypothetical protein
MARLVLPLALVACFAGCGGHARNETASDVAKRLMRVTTGPLAHPASVTCHRTSAKWWSCEVAEAQQPNSLGTSTAEVRVRAR